MTQRIYYSIYIVAMIAVSCANVAVAGVRRDDVADSYYTDLANQPEYAAVGSLTIDNAPCQCSGTLIASRWVLTAGHCVADPAPATVSFVLEGNSYAAAQWFAYPTYPALNLDIGLVLLNNAVETVAPALRFQSGSLSTGGELHSIVTLVGYGITGTGDTGAVEGTEGTKRAGNNVFDRKEGVYFLEADFDNPNNPADSYSGSATPLALEYLSANGDSGGGWFVGSGDETRLLAVHVYGAWVDGENDSDYGDISGAFGVRYFNDWIDDNIAAQWSNAVGGSAHSSGNWQNSFLPDPTDILSFYNVTGAYTVAFTGANSYDRLLVRRGSVTIDLGGATQSFTSTALNGSVVVGRDDGDNASLILTNGTLSSVDGYIGRNFRSTGAITLSTAGTHWVLSDSLYIGRGRFDSGGTATLTVNAGASVEVTDMVYMSGNGTGSPRVNVNGGMITSGVFKLNGGSLNLNGGSVITRDFQFTGGTITGASGGSITANGTNSTWTDGGIISTGGIVNIAPGATMTLSGYGNKEFRGGTLNNAGSIFWNPPESGYRIEGSVSSATINNTGLFDNRADGQISIWVSSGHTFKNVGTFRKSGGTATTSIAWIFNNTGTVEVQTGTLNLTGSVTQLVGSALSAGTWNVLNGSTLSISSGSNITMLSSGASVRLSGATASFAKINSLVTNNGSFQIDSGKNFNASGTFANTGMLAVGNASTFSAGTLTNSGSIAGTGSIAANVQSHGTISPGQSAGRLTINGNLTLFDDSQTSIEIGGLIVGTEHDQLKINSSAILNGLLNLDLINGFAPTAGNSFDIFDWGSVSGVFATLDLPQLAAGLAWNTSQLYTTGIVTVIVGLPGDYNEDGIVGAADYVVWRKNDGTPDGYNLWRANFGTVLSGGSATNLTDALVNVPEPAGVQFVALAVVLFIAASVRLSREKMLTRRWF